MWTAWPKDRHFYPQNHNAKQQQNNEHIFYFSSNINIKFFFLNLFLFTWFSVSWFFSFIYYNNLRTSTEENQITEGGGGNSKAFRGREKYLQDLLFGIAIILCKLYILCTSACPSGKGVSVENKQTGNSLLLVRRKEMVANSAQSLWATGKNQLQAHSYFITQWQGI